MEQQEVTIISSVLLIIAKASVNDILVSGQDFPSQPSGLAVIHYVIILINRYSTIVPFSLMNWKVILT